MTGQLISKRECGQCNTCCVIPEVYEKGINKPPYLPCGFSKHDDVKRFCSIYGTDKRPDMCKEFVCAWMFGYGSDFDDPLHSKVMASINEIDGLLGIYAFELSRGAIETTGRNIIMDMVNKTSLPVILTNMRTTWQ